MFDELEATTNENVTSSLMETYIDIQSYGTIIYIYTMRMPQVLLG